MGAQQGRERAHVSLDKEGGDGVVESSSIRFGYSSCQGWRKEMEDAHTCVGNIAEFPDCSFFGVFDGHGGIGAANYVSANLLQKIVHHASVGRDSALVGEPAVGSSVPPEKIKDSLSTAFIEIDNWMSENMKEYVQKGDSEDPGSTAITTLISPTHYYFAHLGDARAVLCRDGVATFSTQDHKPDQPGETKRIVDAGGFVAAKRVCRCLAVSRAFGDHYFKCKDQPVEARMVSCVPDVAVMERAQEDEFIILACDGVWDVVSSQQACNFVRDKLLGTDTMSEICHALVDHCVHLGSTDNITVILITLQAAKSGGMVQDMIDTWFDGLDDVDPGDVGADALASGDSEGDAGKSPVLSSPCPAVSAPAVSAPAVPVAAAATVGAFPGAAAAAAPPETSRPAVAPRSKPSPTKADSPTKPAGAPSPSPSPSSPSRVAALISGFTGRTQSPAAAAAPAPVTTRVPASPAALKPATSPATRTDAAPVLAGVDDGETDA